MILAIEKWTSVPDFPSYEVSNLGAIRSPRGPLKGETDKDGYTRVALSRNGRKSKFPLHRLVAICFVKGRTPERDIACHRNNVRSDNASSNLKWATQAENVADKIEHGTQQIGSKHPRASVNEAQVTEIKRLIACMPNRKGKLIGIARDLGISPHVVYHVSHGKAWGHI